MKSKKLQNAIGMIDDDLVLRASQETNGKRKRAEWLKWSSAVAAMLVAAIVIGIFLGTGNLNVYAIEEAEYPTMASYPGSERIPGFEGRFDEWYEDKKERRQYYGVSKELNPFIQKTAAEILAETDGKNLVYSPLNVYMALAMLAEITDGESRKQVLDLIGVSDLEALRTQVNAVWNANYSDDGAVTSRLASSLWLNETVDFQKETLRVLADRYYASSYQGEMGSRGLNQALQTWLNEQTGGLLKDMIGNIELPSETIMAIATTIFFQAKWEDEFSEANTRKEVFHGADQDATVDFMHGTDIYGTYYWGEIFSATAKRLENSGMMYFILPDEGHTPEELLANEEALAFLTDGEKWENRKTMIVNLSVPKFDVNSKLDLKKALQELGITDCFSAQDADFSPLLTKDRTVALSRVEHGARVAIDEEGVTATAYTEMVLAGAAVPPADEIDFTLDRPFLFIIKGEDGSILFLGIVNQP